mmetsp:Transcript_39890/g.73899  ORF Transcript_39890/g.73899 Transcript_39890/m.73899 type:complete len:1032 (+) Transcript_39890:2-3097(+)
MLYTNRRSVDDLENKEVRLKFSKGKPATVILKKVAVNDHSFYSYCIPEVTTSFVKIIVKSHYAQGDNGAEEIAFVYSDGQCPKMEMKKEGSGYYKPEPVGGNIPNGEIVPTTKAKCVAKCAANPACKAWNFKPESGRCNLKGSTDPGFQPDPAWIAGEKGEPEDPVPVPLTSCTASSATTNYECAKSYDGLFGAPQDDAGKSWATVAEGVGSWIKLEIDITRTIDTMLYTNRRSFGDDENQAVSLTFSAGSPATVTLKKTDLDDHSFYSYSFPEVTTSSVKIEVKSIYSKGNNGAEEIAFVNAKGSKPEMLKEKPGGFYKPEPQGGNIPNGEFVPISKAKCVAKCAADPACKAWNFRIQDSMCHLKDSTAPGYQSDPKWVAGEKAEPKAKTPAPTPAPTIPPPTTTTQGPTYKPTQPPRYIHTPPPATAAPTSVTAEPCAVTTTTTNPPFAVECPDDGRTQPLNCSGHGKPIQVMKILGAFSVRELDIETGVYSLLFNIPYELVKGFYSDINGCGISPIDGIMYCSMHTALTSYIVRISPCVVEFVARLQSWQIYNSGGFSQDGSKFFLANSTAHFIVVENVHRLRGMTDADSPSLTNLATLPIQRPAGWFSCSDVVTFMKDFDGDGVEDEWLASMAGPRVEVAKWDGTKFSESYIVQTTEGDWGDIWGAGWSFNGKIFFASNAGTGVFEVVLADLYLGNPEKKVTLRKVGLSDKAGSNDGLNCMKSPDPWATQVDPFDCVAHAAPLQLVGSMGGVSVMKMNLETGAMLPVYDLPWSMTTPAFQFLNGVGLNPKDHIPYGCLMTEAQPGPFYIVRFDSKKIEFVAKMSGSFNPIAGTFDGSGNFFFHSHPDYKDGSLYKIPGLDEMTGFTSPTDPNIADLTSVPGMTFADVYQMADIVALQYDTEGTGTLTDFILGINRDQQVIVVKWSDANPGASQVWKFSTNDVLSQYKAKLNFGAAWNFHGRIMFASNDGVGVFEATGFNSTTGYVQLSEIGKSSNVELTDGFNCPNASPFLGNASAVKEPTIDLFKL